MYICKLNSSCFSVMNSCSEYPAFIADLHLQGCRHQRVLRIDADVHLRRRMGFQERLQRFPVHASDLYTYSAMHLLSGACLSWIAFVAYRVFYRSVRKFPIRIIMCPACLPRHAVMRDPASVRG